jgi:hypothetical protein
MFSFARFWLPQVNDQVLRRVRWRFRTVAPAVGEAVVSVELVDPQGRLFVFAAPASEMAEFAADLAGEVVAVTGVGLKGKKHVSAHA